MKINLEKLYKVQKELDDTIAKNHSITYATTREKRILALLVEVGELANSIRCFKFWSNKPSETKERVLDEYADGLHFLLSIGNDFGIDDKEFEVNSNYANDPTDQFHKVYQSIMDFDSKRTLDLYKKAFITYLELLYCLQFTWEDAEGAYFLKLDENYNRQKNNY